MAANLAADPPAALGVALQTDSTKRYVAVVTMSIKDNIKFLEKLKHGFIRTVYWNKYRSKIITQLRNNNSDYMIDPTFRNINMLCSFIPCYDFF